LTRFSRPGNYVVMLKVVRGPDQAPSPEQARDELAPLARRAGAGESAAIAELVRAVGPAMCRAATRVLGPGTGDLDDVMQQALEGLLDALPSFRYECRITQFACRIAVLSALLDRRRAGLRARVAPDGDAITEWPDTEAPSPADAAMAAQRRAALASLLDDLPPAQAEVLILHCALGFTVAEIAASSGRPAETVRSRLRLAKEALRDRIDASRELADVLGRGS
jgi:RNA polymerase sigma-70 factor (ECF subfamily)